MPLFALAPMWNDVFTVGGFFVGVLGFGYTIRQVWKSTTAAVAAERAAEETLAELRTAFRRFIGGLAGRYLAEARSAVASESWMLASTRSNDLADMMGQAPEQATRSADLTNRLRQFAQQFAERARFPEKKVNLKKWQTLLRETQERLDDFQSPFPRRTGDANDPQGPTPPTDPKAPPKDGSG